MEEGDESKIRQGEEKESNAKKWPNNKIYAHKGGGRKEQRVVAGLQ